MKKYFFFLIVNILLSSFVAEARQDNHTTANHVNTRIDVPLNKKIQSLFPNAHVGLVVYHLESNQLIYAKQSDHYFTPASTLKLLTSYAALDYLGPKYTYQTTLKFDPKKGNVIISFSGDPSFTDAKLEQLLLALKNKGISKIKGKIILENHGYVLPFVSPGATWDTWSYYPPVSSIILNENLVSVKLQPSTLLNQSCQANLVASEDTINNAYKLTHQINTVSQQQADQSCSLEAVVDTNNAIHLSGCWPINQPNILSISLASPEKAVAQKINVLLKKLALTYPKKTIYFSEFFPANYDNKFDNDTDLEIIASIPSQPLSDLLVPVLQNSNNLYADSLHKKLGQTHFGIGDYAHGVKAQHAILAKLGIPLDLSQQFDGSGASRYNLITPNQLVALLTHLYEDKKNYPTIFNALPVSGMSGTLKKRFQNEETRLCQNKIRAKTGSLKYTSALAGYLEVNTNHHYAFALMIQGEKSKIKKIKNKEDALLAEIYHLLSSHLDG
jgi:D-alanyl-D-alanine carboxypeptidase/D-alanyl-D-alanine-endopeptidase (penicillin-binding protein 4)